MDTECSLNRHQRRRAKAIDRSLHFLEEDSCSSDIDIPVHNFIKRYCANCGFFYPIYTKCSDRFCFLCCKADYRRLYESYLPVIKASKQLSFVTLTIKNFEHLNPSKVQNALTSFNTFRNYSPFKDRMVGGIAILECKRVSDSKGWNLHIHCLIDSYYLPQKEVSAVWERITGDSFRVDLRRVPPTGESLKYILKYMAKPPVVYSERGDEAIAELRADYNNAFFKTRHVVTFGSFYNAKKDIDDIDYVLSCPVCGGIEWLSESELFNLELYAVECPP